MGRKNLTKFFTLVLVSFTVLSKAHAQLQPEAIQQIQALLDEKASRTPEQQKISSRLLQATREKRGLQMAKGVTLDVANVNATSAGDLKVDIKATVTDQLLSKIAALGGKIIHASVQYNSIRAVVNLSMIEAISNFPEVSFIKPAARARTVGSGLGKSAFLRHNTIEVTSKLINYMLTYRSPALQAPLAGSVTSEGDHAHRADAARTAFGFAGQGVRIGVISDSYNALKGAAADIAGDDLPGVGNPNGNTTPVTVVQDYTASDGSDEGRAMLQIVHDLAPKAQLFFATANIDEAGFAENIIALRNPPYNCDIIIDDIGYSDEPVFQDGIVAQAVNTVTADGALYFSAAGNSGSVAKGIPGYFEGDFDSTGSVAFTKGSKAGSVHNFGTIATPVNGDILLLAGGWYTLNWADPMGASSNDYDLFVLSSSGTVKASSTDIQNGTQDPYEEIDPSSITFAKNDRLVVFKTSGAKVRAFALNVSNESEQKALTVNTTGQLFGHPAAASAFGVAVTPAVSPGPYPGVFVASNTVEDFSSDGPRRMFYNPDGSAITPNNFLFKTNGGNIRNKPDITAADGVSTTMDSQSGLNPFYGTSAAAPHAGAIAGLIKSANPSLTETQIKNIITSTALDIETPGWDVNSGYGIVQAYQAIQSIAPAAYLATDSVKLIEGSFSNGNGKVDPGELADLVIQLDNPSTLTATNISAVVTTSTPGVIITQDSVFYASIASGAFANNATMPFKLGISSSVACGTTIAFTVTVTYGGGLNARQTFRIYVTIGNQLGAIIRSVIGDVPPTGSNYTATSGTQKGRLNVGAAGTCGATLTNPGLSTATGSRQYDAYKFTNTTTASQCVSVTLTSSNGDNLYTSSYNDVGFVATNPSTNFVSASGQSGATQQYNFTVAASKAFTVVVSDNAIKPASFSGYKLNVGLNICAAPPICTPDTITAVPVLFDSVNTVYSQPFAATGGSGSYLFSLIGNLPTGLSFSGNQLSGTPTLPGIYPIVIKTIDAAGCPAATLSDTLIVAATYVFNGSGNWDIASNWLHNSIPPANITAPAQIIIDPVTGSQCILNIPYTLGKGAIMTVKETKNLVVQGNLQIIQ